MSPPSLSVSWMRRPTLDPESVDTSAPPQVSNLQTPSQPSNPSDPPWLNSPSPPPWSVIPQAQPGSLVSLAPPWSTVALALPLTYIPLAPLGSYFPLVPPLFLVVPTLPWSVKPTSPSQSCASTALQAFTITLGLCLPIPSLLLGSTSGLRPGLADENLCETSQIGACDFEEALLLFLWEICIRWFINSLLVYSLWLRLMWL